jgi:hypothetical protein
VTWDVALGYATGLRLLAPSLDPATLVRSLLLIHFLDAIVCRVIAANNGHRRNLWTVLGFVFGIWTVVLLLILPPRRTEGGQPASPPTE